MTSSNWRCDSCYCTEGKAVNFYQRLIPPEDTEAVVCVGNQMLQEVSAWLQAPQMALSFSLLAAAYLCVMSLWFYNFCFRGFVI